MKKYNKTEERVVDYLLKISDNAIGAGPDPVGFLISSHSYMAHMLRNLKELNEKVYWELHNVKGVV